VSYLLTFAIASIILLIGSSGIVLNVLIGYACSLVGSSGIISVCFLEKYLGFVIVSTEEFEYCAAIAPSSIALYSGYVPTIKLSIQSS